MAAFIDDADRIELDDIPGQEREWVEIWHKMAYGDEQSLVGHYTRIQANLRDGTISDDPVTLDMETGNVALLKLNIRSWSFQDQDGNPVPVTTERVRRLDPVIAHRLLQEIVDRNPKVGA